MVLFASANRELQSIEVASWKPFLPTKDWPSPMIWVADLDCPEAAIGGRGQGSPVFTLGNYLAASSIIFQERRAASKLS